LRTLLYNFFRLYGMNFDVVVVGDINVDILAPVSQLPKPEEEVSLKELHLSPGGNACNSALACSRLGLVTGFIGKISKDPLGGYLMGVLEKESVDIGGLKIVPGNTGATVALVYPDSRRSFLSYKGATSTLSLRDVDFDYLRGAKVLFLAGYYHCASLRQDAVTLFKKAKEKGMFTALDTSFDTKGKWTDVYPLLKYTDVVFLGSSEREGVTGEKSPIRAGTFLLKHGARIACVKMGDEGSIIMSERGAEEVPAFKVNAVDGTGCGDAFNAGFLLGLSEKKSLKQCGLLGNAVGAIVATKYGVYEALPTRKELEAFIRERFGR